MKMRASAIREKHKIVCEQVDVVPPNKDELFVRTAWAAICGSDVHVLHSAVPLAERMAYPGNPGHEGIGYLEETEVPGYKKGDLILTVPYYTSRTGTFCDYVTILPCYTVKVPPTDIPLEQLLMAQQFGTTIYSLRQLPVDVMGKTVMVVGQGSAGLFLAWSLKRAGAATVIASDKMPARLAISSQFGVDVPVKAGKEAYQAVMDHTNGKGADYLVEAVGSVEAVNESISLVRMHGNVLFYGLPDTKAFIAFNFHDFSRKGLIVNTTTNATQGGMLSFQRALDLILTKQIDMAPLISHTFSLDRIEDAMDHASTYKDNARKVCIKLF